jgi:hypothetical protein
VTKMNDELLLQYMSHFAGYGNLHGNYWMIGMEEGGGDTIEEIERRVTIWDESGQNTLEDLKLYHDKIGQTRWFGDQAKLQPTWNKLIRIIHGIKGQSPQTEDIRTYQKTHLGRHDSETCLAELMPLPSPSTRHWLYPQISTLPELRSRESYLRNWGHVRLKMLTQLINTYRPQNVVLYGMGYYQEWWSQLMPSNHKMISIEGVKAYLGSKNGTVFGVSPHPVATGVKNTFFQGLGNAIREIPAY